MAGYVKCLDGGGKVSGTATQNCLNARLLAELLEECLSEAIVRGGLQTVLCQIEINKVKTGSQTGRE